MANQPFTSNHTSLIDETTYKITTQPFAQSNLTATQKHQRTICDRTSISFHGTLQLQNPYCGCVNCPNDCATSIQTLQEDIPGGKSFTFRPANGPQSCGCGGTSRPQYAAFDFNRTNPMTQLPLLTNTNGGNRYNEPKQNLHFNKYSSTVDLVENPSKGTPDFRNLPAIVANLESLIYNDPSVPSSLQKVTKFLQLTKTADINETQESVRERDRKQYLKEDKENQTVLVQEGEQIKLKNKALKFLLNLSQLLEHPCKKNKKGKEKCDKKNKNKGKNKKCTCEHHCGCDLDESGSSSSD